MVHPFIVEVRAIMQNWMGRARDFWGSQEIVKCKLKHLPGDAYYWGERPRRMSLLIN